MLSYVGGSVTIIDNLKKFCEINNLKYSSMSNLSRGIGNTNNGFKCIKYKQ